MEDHDVHGKKMRTEWKKPWIHQGSFLQAINTKPVRSQPTKIMMKQEQLIFTEQEMQQNGGDPVGDDDDDDEEKQRRSSPFMIPCIIIGYN